MSDGCTGRNGGNGDEGARPPVGTTRREILYWGIAAVGAIGAGAGLALVGGRPVGGAQAPTLPLPPMVPTAWRETGGWTLDLAHPHAVASRSGDVLVAGGATTTTWTSWTSTLVVGGDREVHWFSLDGTLQRRVAIDGAVLAMAISADGSVWLARCGAVERLAADGTVAWRCALPDGCLPGGLAVAGGLIWVSDCAGRRVLRIAADGSPAAGLSGCDSFIIPSPWFPLSSGPDGLVWVANTGRHRLEAYGSDGRQVRTWGAQGMDVPRFCGCCNPAFVQVLPDGRFVTAEKGIPRVKLHAADGTFAELVAGPDAFHPDTVGLAVAPDGRGGLAVLDPHAGRIRLFGRSA